MFCLTFHLLHLVSPTLSFPILHTECVLLRLGLFFQTVIGQQTCSGGNSCSAAEHAHTNKCVLVSRSMWDSLMHKCAFVPALC